MTRAESRGVWLLAIGQTAGFASLIYVFGAILLSLESGSGWTRSELALGPTLALVVQAVAAPFSGRLVDQGRGALLLGGSAAAGAVCLALLSRVTALPLWYLVWLVIGIAQATGLYDTCFSVLTRRLGPEARQAIIRVTLVAGFASTFAFPVGAWSGAVFGWRGALLLFAAMQLCVTLPANLLGMRLLRTGPRRGGPMEPTPTGALRASLRRREFWALAAFFGLLMGNHMILTTYALPVLTERGATPAMAVLIASTVGPMQVAGRVLLMLGGARIGAGLTARAIAIGMALASGALLLAAGQLWLFVLYATLQGASIGVQSILRPLLTGLVLGHENFGAKSGAIAMAPLLTSAAAPVMGAFLLGAGGTTLLLSATLTFALAALALALWLRTRGI